MQKLRQLVSAGAEDRAALEVKYRSRISEMDQRLKEVRQDAFSFVCQGVR